MWLLGANHPCEPLTQQPGGSHLAVPVMGLLSDRSWPREAARWAVWEVARQGQGESGVQWYPWEALSLSTVTFSEDQVSRVRG